MCKTKQCRDCDEKFPIGEFKERKYYTNGVLSYISLDPRCNECRLRNQRERKKKGYKPKKLKPLAVIDLSDPINAFLYGGN